MPRLSSIPHVLLLVDTAAPFGRSVIQGIGRYALENGPWSIQFVYRALDSLPPQWLKQWRGDGIISRTMNLKQAKMLWATKVPLVELHSHPKIGIPQVRIDLVMEGRMAVDHLLNCGLRQFAFFSYGEAWWIRLHREAFCRAVKEREYDCHSYQPPASVGSVPAWREGQRPGLIKWLRSLPRPIGIFTAGDIHSAFLLDICRENNVAVPEELAILGMGNDSVICETVRPTLSSIDVGARHMGYEAARLLDRMMAGKPAKDVIFVPPSHVVVRQSTDLVAIEDADVAQTVRIIRESACAGIDVARIAEQVGLSRRALERRFLQYVGRTPKSEIMRVRLEHAKTLMAQTDNTSESIARKSGFSSLEYFTRVFRRKVGMKPQAYRKMRRISRDLGGADED
jgi:LacI family transcriptional regulator